ARTRRSLHSPTRANGQRLRAKRKHRAVAGEEGHTEKNIANKYFSTGDHRSHVEMRQWCIPPEDVEHDSHAHEKHERSVEAEQDRNTGQQLHGFHGIKQMAVQKCKQRLMLQRNGGEISRLRKYM